MRVNCFAQEHNALTQSGLKPGLQTQSLAHYPVGPLCLIHPDTYILKISSQQKQIFNKKNCTVCWAETLLSASLLKEPKELGKCLNFKGAMSYMWLLVRSSWYDTRDHFLLNLKLTNTSCYNLGISIYYRGSPCEWWRRRCRCCLLWDAGKRKHGDIKNLLEFYAWDLPWSLWL